MEKAIVSKKRKASVPESGTEKVKKAKKVVEVQEQLVKKRKATDNVAVTEVKKSKSVSSVTKPRVEQPVKANPIKKTTTSVKVDEKFSNSKSTKATKNGASVSKKAVSESKDKESKPAQSIDADEIDDEDEEMDDGDASEVDDQTEALLKGFESDRDEEDGEDTGLEAGQEVPELSKKQKKKVKKLQEKAQPSPSDKPGVVYIGRIPHGFYEHEMREYFKQFGNILKLRLSRNPKTGASKHYAFLQFESNVAADIVAKTMDNYLLFGHLLKVKVIPDEQVPADLFKGANKRFKKVPWNSMEGRRLKQGATEAIWQSRIESTEKKRAEKAAKLKAIGYEFEAPKIKSANGVAKEVEIPAITEKDDPDVKAIEAAPISEESSNLGPVSKKTKKAKNSKAKDPTEALANVPVTEVVEKKAEVKVVEGGDVPEVKVTKSKKSKKAKAT